MSDDDVVVVPNMTCRDVVVPGRLVMMMMALTMLVMLMLI